jgi:hypothetical protein
VTLGPVVRCRRRRAQHLALPVEPSKAFWAVTALRITLQASSLQLAAGRNGRRLNSKSSNGYS